MRQTLERLHTLVGKSFMIIIITKDPNSDTLKFSRNLLEESRNFQYIIQPPTRIDISLEINFVKGIQDPESERKQILQTINEEISRERIGDKTREFPILLAMVGFNPETLDILSSYRNVCQEYFKTFATAGYVIFWKETEDVLPSINICTSPPPEKQPRLKVRCGLPKESQEQTSSSFLIGKETVVAGPDQTYNVKYAIRNDLGKDIKVPTAPSRSITKWTPAKPPVEVKERKKVEKVEKEENSWNKHVKLTVKRILRNSLIDQDDKQDYIGGGLTLKKMSQDETERWIDSISSRKEWQAVFTHVSVNSNDEENYETFETIGDKVLSLILVNHLVANAREMKNSIDSNSLTDIHKEILSGPRQSTMAKHIGLTDVGLIRSTSSVDDAILEDVFEAFFGCLYWIVNDLSDAACPNQGLTLSQIIFHNILNSTFPELNLWSIQKDAPTQLDQLMRRLNWGPPTLRYDKETGRTTIIITDMTIQKLNEKAGLLNKSGQNIELLSNRILCVGSSGTDKRSSERLACELGLKMLKQIWGIDNNYATLLQRQRLIRDPEYSSTYQEALIIVRSMGYNDIYVSRKAKHHNQYYVVTGIKKNSSGNEVEKQLHYHRYTPRTPQGLDERDQSGITHASAYTDALRGFIKMTQEE